MANQQRRKRPAQRSGRPVFGDTTARTTPRRPPPPPKPWVRRNRGAILGAIGVVIVVAAVVILAIYLARPAPLSKSEVTTDQPAPASLVASVTKIPASDFDSVGTGSVPAGIIHTISATPLTANGKPQVLYVGGEYCPYCAAERWAMVAALSRFGSFSNLQTTRSSASDVFPNTPTFSFYGSSYTSPYLTFTSIEHWTNQPASGGGYQTLQPLSGEAGTVFDTYNKPPYVDSAGGIPFVDLGGKYVFSGATYSPGVLAGMNWNQVAAALANPSTAQAKGIIGSANVITAAICSLTNQQPASVCQSSGVQKGAALLNGR